MRAQKACLVCLEQSHLLEAVHDATRLRLPLDVQEARRCHVAGLPAEHSSQTESTSHGQHHLIWVGVQQPLHALLLRFGCCHCLPKACVEAQKSNNPCN